jgi:hypothetical protein
MANLKGLASIVAELRAERTNLANHLKHVDAALSVLGRLGGGSRYTKPKRKVSTSARKRMSLAQKARWAASRNKSQPVAAAAKTTGSAPAKRTMSASARRKISLMQKARWSKIRAAKKKAA